MAGVDRVLVEIVTAANMTGIKEAQAGFLKMNSALTAGIVGLGLAVVAGKSAIDIAEKHEAAENDLAQAVASVNDQYGRLIPASETATASVAKANAQIKQSTYDVGIAQRNASLTQREYTAAVRQHGAASVEAYRADTARKEAAHRLADAQAALAKATKERAAAEAELAPHVSKSMIDLEIYRKEIDQFIASNRAYISDQSEVIAGYATLTRAGLSIAEVQKDMNRAVDLAAIKNISLSDAVKLVDDAEHGRLKGLIDLGITSKAYVDSSGNVVDANKNMAKVMKEFDAATEHGRDTTTKMTQATNKLSNDWQDISNIVGPPLLGLLTGVADGVDAVTKQLEALGKNKDWNKFISDAFGHWQDLVVGIAGWIKDIIDGIKWVIDNAGKMPGGGSGSSPTSAGRRGLHAAGGGTFVPGDVVTVGESSQETMVVGAGATSIIPGGGGRSAGGSPIVININNPLGGDGPYWDNVANRIAQRLAYVTGR